MADIGHVAIRGFKAGAIKYTALRGYVPNPGAGTVNACLVTRGFGVANTHKKALRGFVPHSVTPGGGSFCIFGGSIITSSAGDGWL